MADASKVGTGKPKVGGAVYRGATTATLPTGTEGNMTGFTSVGYISEDGVSNAISVTSNDIKAWGGDIVDSSETEYKDEFKMVMIESLNDEAMKVYFGDENVSGTLETGITVKSNSKPQGYHAYVVDTVQKGYTRRLVFPRAKVSSKDEIVYKDDTVVAYGVTLLAAPDTAGNTHYEYIK